MHIQIQRRKTIAAAGLKRLASYLLVGSIAATFDFAFFLTFSTWLGVNYLVVGGSGFVLATLINYWLSVHRVFESGSRFNRQAEIMVVYAVSLIGLMIHATILIIAVEVFSLFGPVAKILATGSVFFWNFGVRNYYVFRPKT
jgi:putative flippase GtrA